MMVQKMLPVKVIVDNLSVAKTVNFIKTMKGDKERERERGGKNSDSNAGLSDAAYLANDKGDTTGAGSYKFKPRQLFTSFYKFYRDDKLSIKPKIWDCMVTARELRKGIPPGELVIGRCSSCGHDFAVLKRVSANTNEREELSYNSRSVWCHACSSLLFIDYDFEVACMPSETMGALEANKEIKDFLVDQQIDKSETEILHSIVELVSEEWRYAP